MRIAVLMNTAIPWAREAARGLSAMGHEVQVIDFAEWSADAHHRAGDEYQNEELRQLRESVASVDFLRSRVRSGLRYFTAAPKLKTLLKQRHAQVLLALYGGGLAAISWASGFRPYAVYVVGSDVLLATGVRRRLNQVSLTHAETVFANGRHLAAETSKLASKARVNHLYLGIDTDVFAPSARSASPVRIVCTRGFAEIYNNESLIRALAELPEDVPEFTVTFVSGGPQLASAQKLADELLSPQVRARVSFLGGVTRECLVNIVRNAHIYFSGSRSDGASASLMEALASGVFPVLSDIPQNREWVTEAARNGTLFPLDQAEVLATALDSAIRNAQLRAKAAAYNRNLVTARANSKNNLRTLSAALEGLCANGASRQ